MTTTTPTPGPAGSPLRRRATVLASSAVAGTATLLAALFLTVQHSSAAGTATTPQPAVSGSSVAGSTASPSTSTTTTSGSGTAGGTDTGSTDTGSTGTGSSGSGSDGDDNPLSAATNGRAADAGSNGS